MGALVASKRNIIINIDGLIGAECQSDGIYVVCDIYLTIDSNRSIIIATSICIKGDIVAIS